MGGVAYSRINVDLRQDNPFEDNTELRSKLFLEVKGEPRENLLAHVSALAEHTVLSGQRTRMSYQLGLYEGFLRWRKDRWDFFAGSQIVDWSQADVSVLDNLNPRNLSEFFAREDEFLKLPVLMGRAVYALDENTFEGAYLPFYVPSRFDLYGSDWSMLNNKALGDYQGEIDTDVYMRQGFKPGIDDYPEANGVNGTFGFRWIHRGERFDTQLSATNGWATLPLFQFNPDFARYLAAQPEGARKTLQTLTPQEVLAYSPLYRSRPVRQTQFGGGFSGPLGDSTLRGELAVVHPQELYTNAFRLTRHTLVPGTLGLDRFFPLNLYANISYLGAYVGQYPREGLFLLRRYNHFALAMLRASYFDDWFTPEARAIVDLNRGSYLVNVRLPVKVADTTLFTLGVYAINGPIDSLFGQLRENGLVYAQIRYSF